MVPLTVSSVGVNGFTGSGPEELVVVLCGARLWLMRELSFPLAL